MARALASVGAAAAAAAGFGPPRLVVLGLVLATVWAISLTVFLCGHGHSSDKKIGVDPREKKNKKNKKKKKPQQEAKKTKPWETPASSTSSGSGDDDYDCDE